MIPNPWPGFHFVFEGADGCGKTKQREMACRWLGKTLGDMSSTSIVLAKEPGKERFWGREIYRDLNDVDNPDALHKTMPFNFQTWYAMDSRENYHDIIIPALKDGHIILSDRSRTSMVFGARNPEDDIPKLMVMNLAIVGECFILPEAVFIFDVNSETAIQRSLQKGRMLDGHENKSVLERTIRNYRYFSTLYPNCHVINAERTPEEIFEDVKKIISAILVSKNKPA